MGVPHLITFLRPYAELDSLAGQNVVVDGPAFAYYIYYLCLNLKPGAQNPFEAAPSYEQLGRAAIDWLDGLRRNDVTIQKIYFDGLLPPSKFSVRLKRLAAQTRQLVEYYNTHPTPCRAPFTTRKGVSPSLFPIQSVFAGLTTLPPVPLLVPAILETLGGSELYKAITEVVPGEADLYCARYLKNHGGIVLTGDSDLLVHDLGAKGAVSFFKDIEVSSTAGLQAWRCQMYNPVAIAARLGLPNCHGMRALAFEMSMDSQGTFRKLLTQATAIAAINAHEKMYEDFCHEYTPLSTEMEKIEDTSKILGIFRYLDPRISEFILQFPSLRKFARQGSAAGTPSSEVPHIFLPFLLDCPVRASAWEMSTSVRQLAYGLINVVVPESQHRFSVFEHRRQQKTSSSREFRLPAISEIPNACIDVINLLNRHRNALPDVCETDLWIAVAVYQDAERSLSLENAILTGLVTEQLVDLERQSSPHISCTWDIVHFLAQIHGSYYSFRILKQITSLLVSHDWGCSLPDPIHKLHRLLGSLPVLCEILDLNHVSSIIRKIESTGMLQFSCDVLGIEKPQSIETPEISLKSSRKRRKSKAVKGVARSPTSQTSSNNRFQLLGQR